MKIIWLGMLFEIILLALLQPFIEDFDGAAIIAVLSHMLFTLLILMSYKSKFRYLFLFAFLIRGMFAFWDLYVFRLPHSGADSEYYYSQAIRYSLNLFAVVDSGELYAKTMGVLFYIIGPDRLVGQYINVLLGLSTLWIIYKILVILDLKPRIVTLVLTLSAFFPNSLFMSAIFLREAFPTFFVAGSALYFIKWFNHGRNIDMFLSFISVGIASAFHAGVIGLIAGYAFVFMFYRKGKDSYTFTFKSVVVFVLISLLFSAGFAVFPDVLLAKFKNIEEISDIYTVTNYREGGSVYLENLMVSSPIELMLYGPIKGLFFLTMPLPMYWRGFMDVLTFIVDSCLYLGTIIYLVWYRNKFGHRRTLVIGLILALLGSVLIFGVGVSNAGTAVRHRQKLVPVVLVTLAVMMDGVSSILQKRLVSGLKSTSDIPKK